MAITYNLRKHLSLHLSIFWTKKTLFNQIHTLFHPTLAISSIFLIEVKKNWRKKITIIWQNVDIYFEMKQFGTMVPKLLKRLTIIRFAIYVFEFPL